MGFDMGHRLTLAAIVPLCAALAACTLPPPRLDAERQWGEAISNLGLFPIYPPSEDVMVGDVFLHTPNSQYFDLVRVTSAPVGALAEQFCYQEQDRPAIDTPPRAAVPATTDRAAIPADPGGAPGNVLCQDGVPRGTLRAVAPTDLAPNNARHMTRLREAALPRLEVGRFSQGEVAGGLTSGNIGLALGFGSSGASGIRVELGGLQSAALEEVRASRLMVDVQLARLRAPRDFQNSLTPIMLLRSLYNADNRNGTTMARSFCRADFDALNTLGARIVVANRVLYATSVNYDFLSERIAATRLALDFLSALPNQPQNPSQPTLDAPKPDQSGGNGNQGGQGNPTQTGAAALQAEQARLLRMAGNLLTLPVTASGRADARLTVGQFGNLSLNRSFARPAAVGMGASLHFPLSDAAVPVNDIQIEEVLRLCEVHFGRDANRPALQTVLKANLDWLKYLNAPIATPDERGTTRSTPLPRATVPLPRYSPRADSRVRL